MLARSIVGSPETVRAGLDALIAETGADELMIVSDVYDHARPAAFLRADSSGARGRRRAAAMRPGLRRLPAHHAFSSLALGDKPNCEAPVVRLRTSTSGMSSRNAKVTNPKASMKPSSVD